MPDMLQLCPWPSVPRRVAVVLLAMALALGASLAQATLLIRVSHVVAEETPKGLAMNRFKALVEQRSAKQIDRKSVV